MRIANRGLFHGFGGRRGGCAPDGGIVGLMERAPPPSSATCRRTQGLPATEREHDKATATDYACWHLASASGKSNGVPFWTIPASRNRGTQAIHRLAAGRKFSSCQTSDRTRTIRARNVVETSASCPAPRARLLEVHHVGRVIRSCRSDCRRTRTRERESSLNRIRRRAEHPRPTQSHPR